MDVIVSHVNADFDSLGALVGAARLYPDAARVLPQGEGGNVREFLALHRDALQVRTPVDIDPETITRVVVVDTPSRKRLGPAEEWLDLPNVEIHLWDHHLDGQASIRADWKRQERWGATCSLLAHELRTREVTLTPIEATTMLLGIYEDTGRLTYSATTAEDLEAAAWLLRSGADLGVVEQFTRRTLTPGQRQVLQQVLESLEVEEVGGVQIAMGVTEPGPYVEDAAVVASTLLEAGEADAAFLLTEMDGVLYAIGRSRTHGVDVAGALRELGGGGHRRAASARIKGGTVEEVRPRLLEALARHVSPERTAREIMSYPVRAISPDTPVSEARQKMVRYGHSGLLVMEGDEICGIATRRDVDKARHHRLDHAPIRGFMTRNVRTVPPETPVSKLEEEMIEHGIGRLPVVRGGHVVGMVTRTDVLRALHGARYVRGIHKPEQEGLSQQLRERLPARIQRVLEDAGTLAVTEDAHVYVVGGFIRDLLLGVRNLDLDLLVEPDGVELARSFAEQHEGLYKDKGFGTAKVELPDGTVVEFATARTESYAQPGALPDVEPSSVVDDLRRRDFTINAMAVALRPEQFGKLLDPFGGRADLDRRRIRVLHNLSFLEDPTRIFRAVRFENRFHFRMDAHTEDLARHAIRDNVLSRISPERLRRELFFTFREPRALGALLRLQELHILEWLAPSLRLDEGLLQSLPGALEWWHKRVKESLEVRLIYLAAVLAPLGVEAAVRIAEQRLRLAPPDAKRMREALAAMERWEELLPPGAAPSALTAALRALPPEALVLLRCRAGARDESQELLERFVTRWRDTKLEITGEDLKALGYPAGPQLGEALRRTLDARIDGHVHGRKAELEHAVSLLNASAA